jgi:hypothetical protein
MSLHKRSQERAYYMVQNNQYPNLTDLERYENANNIEIKMDKRLNNCRICYNSRIDNDYKCLCYNSFCKSCLKEYVRVNIYNNKYILHIPFEKFKIKCPILSCKGLFHISPYLEEKYFDDNMTKIDFGNKIFNITDCIKPDCEGKLIEDECSDCLTKICFKCGSESHLNECDADTINNFNELIKLGGTNINQCPTCKFVIFKVSGCSTQFCWKCSSYFNWNNNKFIKKLKIKNTYKNANMNGDYYKSYNAQLKSTNEIKGLRVDL